MSGLTKNQWKHLNLLLKAKAELEILKPHERTEIKTALCIVTDRTIAFVLKQKIQNIDPKGEYSAKLVSVKMPENDDPLASLFRLRGFNAQIQNKIADKVESNNHNGAATSEDPPEDLVDPNATVSSIVNAFRSALLHYVQNPTDDKAKQAYFAAVIPLEKITIVPKLESFNGANILHQQVAGKTDLMVGLSESDKKILLDGLAPFCVKKIVDGTNKGDRHLNESLKTRQKFQKKVSFNVEKPKPATSIVEDTPRQLTKLQWQYLCILLAARAELEIGKEYEDDSRTKENPQSHPCEYFKVRVGANEKLDLVKTELLNLKVTALEEKKCPIIPLDRDRNGDVSFKLTYNWVDFLETNKEDLESDLKMTSKSERFENPPEGTFDFKAEGEKLDKVEVNNNSNKNKNNNTNTNTETDTNKEKDKEVEKEDSKVKEKEKEKEKDTKLNNDQNPNPNLSKETLQINPPQGLNPNATLDDMAEYAIDLAMYPNNPDQDLLKWKQLQSFADAKHGPGKLLSTLYHQSLRPMPVRKYHAARAAVAILCGLTLIATGVLLGMMSYGGLTPVAMLAVKVGVGFIVSAIGAFFTVKGGALLISPCLQKPKDEKRKLVLNAFCREENGTYKQKLAETLPNIATLQKAMKSKK